jgi:hypothetical protein
VTIDNLFDEHATMRRSSTRLGVPSGSASAPTAEGTERVMGGGAPALVSANAGVSLAVCGNP